MRQPWYVGGLEADDRRFGGFSVLKMRCADSPESPSLLTASMWKNGAGVNLPPEVFAPHRKTAPFPVATLYFVYPLELIRRVIPMNQEKLAILEQGSLHPYLFLRMAI